MGVTLTGMDASARSRGRQYKSRVYVWNGRNSMRAYDGANWSLAGIQKVTFTPGAAVNGAGNLTGKYVWILAPVNSQHFNLKGQVTAGIPCSVSAELALNAQNAIISNIPATHPDAQVDYWFLYRNLAGARNAVVEDEAQNYYFVDRIAIGTTTYVDQTADVIIKNNDTIRFNQNIPPCFKFGELYGERLFGCGFDPFATGTATLATKTITNKVLTSDVATITTSAAHGYTVGMYVTVATTSADQVFDGCFKITVVGSTTTFSYARNNNQTNVGSVAESGTTQVINFTSALPDGIVGAWFQVQGQNAIYRIIGYNSTTQIAVVGQGQAGFSGALSAASFNIFRYPWIIYVSEFEDPEAWGPDGEAFRWVREVPGRDPCNGLLAYQGKLWVFSTQNIYAIYGKGPDISDVNIGPEPVYKGLGAVGGDAIDTVEAEIWFMTLRGPAVMIDGGAPQLTGQILLTDWIDSLNSSDLALSVTLCSGRYVYMSVCAATGDAQPSKSFRYDRYTQTWWEEADWVPTFGFHDDGDNGLVGRGYYVQGASIFEPNTGTYDVVSTNITGTVTSATTTSLTNTGAAFPTATGGMVEATVRVFDASGNFVAKRRITTNTATSMTWSNSGVGGGTVAGIVAGYTYEIGSPWWHWKTRTVESAAHQQLAYSSELFFDHIDATQSVKVTEYYDIPVTGGESTAKGQPITQALRELTKKFPLQTGGKNYALYIESRNLARVRDISLDMGVSEETNE